MLGAGGTPRTGVSSTSVFFPTPRGCMGGEEEKKDDDGPSLSKRTRMEKALRDQRKELQDLMVAHMTGAKGISVDPDLAEKTAKLRTAISNGEKELEAVVLAMGGKFKSQGAKRAMVGA